MNEKAGLSDRLQLLAAAGSGKDLEIEVKILGEKGDFETAWSLLELAVATRPVNAAVWHNLGLARTWRQDIVSAVDAYTRAIDGGHPSHVERGLLLEQLHRSDEAVADYNAALSIDENDLDALVDLGTLELQDGHVSEAKLLLIRATNLDAKANWQLADVYLAEGQLSLARESLESAIAAGEQRAYLDLALMDVDIASERITRSRFSEAVAANAAGATREFVLFLKRSGREDEAMQMCLQAVDSGDTECNSPLASFFESQGKLELAAQYYKLSVDIGEEEDVAKLERVLRKISSQSQ